MHSRSRNKARAESLWQPTILEIQQLAEESIALALQQECREGRLNPQALPFSIHLHKWVAEAPINITLPYYSHVQAFQRI